MAKKYKKEIWIGVQDLSKAYDRINISLLRLAMARLRFPQPIIELILQLFTDRTNRIILHNDSISDPYQVMQGIDQGEVVSPLLWIIYYDPLFARINSLRELAFTVELQQIKNIWNPAADQKVSYSTTVQSYLDDTTWVAPSLTHMKTLLEISNEFYELANIQINKDKYRLLTNNKLYVGKEIELILGTELTKVKINKKKEGVRILGVYIDAFNSPSPTLKKLRQTVVLFANTLRRKKLTHNHVVYITNKVLMPILEYRNQFQVFTIEQCNFVMAPIKKLFKQSLHLPRSTPDALIHHYLLPSINNFFYNQMYSHIAMTQLLFNTPLLNPIAMTQMLTTQYEFWLPHFPTHNDLTKLESTKLATTFLSKLLIYFNNFNIVFTPVYDTTITGGRTPLLFHIPNITKSDVSSLQNKRLIFLDQIISNDSSFLLTFPEMKQMAQKNWKGAPPNWLKKMENTEIWTTTNRRLINPPKELPIQNFLIQTPNILPNQENQLRNQWYIFWDPKSNTSIYGKGITQINHKNTPSMTQLQHYVQSYLEDDALFASTTSSIQHDAFTPRKKTTLLKPCKGCALHTYNVDRPLICTIYTVTTSLYKFKLYNQNIMKRKFPNVKKLWKFPTKHHITLHNMAYNSFLKLNRSSFSHFNFNSNFIINDLVHNQEFSLQELAMNCNLDKNHFYFLYNIFKGNQYSLDTLYLLIIKFLFRDRLIFYTDGSLSMDGTNKSIMGAAWVEVSSSGIDTFQCSTAHLPSSTKAEVLAILTAIIASPTHCHVTIHTDSKNAIDSFNKTGRNNLSQRRIMKLNNFSLWILIHRLIKTKSLRVDMFKVKAHSGQLHNDQADRLAKDACSNLPIFLATSHYSQAPVMVPTLANYGPIDKNIRKYFRHITNLHTFEKLLRMKALSHLFGPSLDQVDQINWELTKDWIAQSCDGSVCSAANDRHTGFKIKNLGHILPTVDIQRLYYPKLYLDTTSNCILCNSTTASNTHWGLCQQHQMDRLADYKDCLSVLIRALEHHKEIATAPSADIAVSSSPLSCFDLEHNSSFYILLHNAVPTSLSDLIARFIRSRKVKSLVTNTFLSVFMDTIIRKYWRKYALAYKQWEKSLHITKRDKQLYRKRRNQDNEPNHTPEPSLSRPSSLPGTRRRDDLRRLVYAGNG
ncbi:ribonuclease H-like domain-containing protein [Rhizophagus clarus]|uniref:Ribonuclease H-like domain-containing protein n=1 Tax=Rhizophagus clarus TaxID=94130 RepID=A0A8H3QML0_9GLOM|nr:ribonuclease H-like domain-containing protein [Rhizophagus clarus]